MNRAVRRLTFWLSGSLVVVLASWAAYLLVSSSTAPAFAIPEPNLSTAHPRVAQVVKELRDRVCREPSSDSCWGRLGMALMANKWDHEAGVCLQTAAQLNPGELRWLYFAAILQERTNLPAALEAFPRAAAVEPNYAPLRYRWAVALVRSNSLDDAEAQFRRAAELAPDLPQPHVGLGRVANSRGDFTMARSHFERAISIAPAHHAARVELARVNFRLGNMASDDQRERMLAPAARPSDEEMPDPILQELGQYEVSVRQDAEQAEQFLAGGDLRSAANVYHKMVVEHPELSRPRLNLATILMSQGDIKNALATYREVVDQYPDDVMAHYAFASALEAAGDTKGAINSYRNCTRLKVDYAQAHFALGLLLEKKEDLPHAIESYRLAVESDSRLAPAHLALGVALQKTGNLAEAIEYIRNACDLASHDPVPRQYLERALSAQQSKASAAKPE